MAVNTWRTGHAIKYGNARHLPTVYTILHAIARDGNICESEATACLAADFSDADSILHYEVELCDIGQWRELAELDPVPCATAGQAGTCCDGCNVLRHGASLPHGCSLLVAGKPSMRSDGTCTVCGSIIADNGCPNCERATD